ncbi:MAG: hypothetical protein HY319_29950 [Armatimonadetes bacterium]|nr:hypothetical protein [Armatimonadota bacterium]
MKWKESESVRQVREWRAKVAEQYEALPREDGAARGTSEALRQAQLSLLASGAKP